MLRWDSERYISMAFTHRILIHCLQTCRERGRDTHAHTHTPASYNFGRLFSRTVLAKDRWTTTARLGTARQRQRQRQRRGWGCGVVDSWPCGSAVSGDFGGEVLDAAGTAALTENVSVQGVAASALTLRGQQQTTLLQKKDRDGQTNKQTNK